MSLGNEYGELVSGPCAEHMHVLSMPDLMQFSYHLCYVHSWCLRWHCRFSSWWVKGKVTTVIMTLGNLLGKPQTGEGRLTKCRTIGILTLLGQRVIPAVEVQMHSWPVFMGPTGKKKKYTSLNTSISLCVARCSHNRRCTGMQTN